MSILGKKWVVKNNNKSKTALEKIIENRDISKYPAVFHDPFLFRDMEKTVTRINEAIKNNERIIIFGDYDVDGITATAIMVNLLKKLNANASYRLPNRLEDGYGLSEKFIEDFVKNDVKLLITVDCGISCGDIISKIKEKGIDVIITDHHTIPKVSPKDAYAIIHPKENKSKYPFPELTGSGVALKLAQALIIKNISKKDQEKLLESFMDLAALGTVADLGQLKGENWLIVKKGLETLAKTKWVGLKKIMELAAVGKGEMNADTIGFRIAPRLNAAGRIDDPYVSLSLLLQDEASEKVNLLSEKLEKLNSQRKDMTRDAFIEAEKSMDLQNMPFILIAENTAWHVGILGLVAGQLSEKYARPVIIMQDFGDMLVASARSPLYFNITDALTAHSKYLVTFGGHAQAAGFNIKKENLEKFKKEISTYAKEKLKNTDLKPILEIDCELCDKDINFDLLKEIEKLRPFGISNTKPTFLLQGMEPHFIDSIGKEKEHLKFILRTNNQDLHVIAFRMGRFVDNIRKHRKIDLVFNLERNHWNDKDYLRINAIDFKESDR